MPARPPAKIHWWYERFADLLIAKPEATLTALAAELNCSLAWLSTIKNSDVFKDYWARRSGDASKVILGDIRAKAAASAEMALDIINDKLAAEGPGCGQDIPMGQLLDIVDTSMKRFGYDQAGGSKAPAGPSININLGTVKPEELALARERMRQITVELPKAEALEAIED
jgi:hypothetical protein